MSDRKNRSIDDREFHRLNDLNLSSFWWHSGTEWTSLIRNEVSKDNYENTSRPKPKSTDKPILYSFAAIIVLLGLAIITRTGENVKVIQAENSAQQVIYTRK
jgi:hypothetical protein